MGASGVARSTARLADHGTMSPVAVKLRLPSHGAVRRESPALSEGLPACEIRKTVAARADVPPLPWVAVAAGVASAGSLCLSAAVNWEEAW